MASTMESAAESTPAPDSVPESVEDPSVTEWKQFVEDLMSRCGGRYNIARHFLEETQRAISQEHRSALQFKNRCEIAAEKGYGGRTNIDSAERLLVELSKKHKEVHMQIQALESWWHAQGGWSGRAEKTGEAKREILDTYYRATEAMLAAKEKYNSLKDQVEYAYQTAVSAGIDVESTESCRKRIKKMES